MHEHERDEGSRKEYLDYCEDGRHVLTRLANVREDEARQRIQKLLVTGDNRLKQGVAPQKVRETYEEALRVATEAGLEDSVRPLVEVRLADLDRRHGP